jgi:NAD(P)-dependent dehydrogenase (short-subunit alcohol dehydrogenase family)
VTATKLALITGANKGIGFEAARQLAQRGFCVLIGARQALAGQDAAKKLTTEGGEAEFVLLDVTSDNSVEEAARAVGEKHGRLDVLVNNAGIQDDAVRPSQLSIAALQKTLATNLEGPIRVSKAFLPLLGKSSDARIINVSSTWGSIAALSKMKAQVPGYHISKAALNMWTVMLAQDLRRDRIKVNSICPGWVKTDMGGASAPRTVAQGAAIITKLATQEDSPTGGLFDDAGSIAW